MKRSRKMRIINFSRAYTGISVKVISSIYAQLDDVKQALGWFMSNGNSKKKNHAPSDYKRKFELDFIFPMNPKAEQLFGSFVSSD